MNKRSMRIIISILLYAFIFIGLNRTHDVQAVSAKNNELELDDVLEDYIRENVPDTAVPIEASFMTDYVQITSKEKIGINDEIDTELYSFTSYEEKTTVYTIISITYPSTVKISQKDTITVTANDYVANFSPAEAILLTKSKQEDEWTKKRDIAAMVTGQQVEIYSGEIYNREPYSRVILSFPALKSAETAEDAPRYHIQYTNYKDNSHVEWIIAIALLVLVVLLLLIYNKRIHCNDNLE